MTFTDALVETEVWEPDPERPGFLRKIRVKTVGEVFAEIAAAVGDYPEGCNEYFGVYAGVGRDRPWPEGRTVVFPVTGGNEGHYIHVEVLHGGRAMLLLLGKTFDGWDPAWRFAQRVAQMLGV